MATFTCSTPLNIKWFGNELIGTPTTTYRIPDALELAMDREPGTTFPLGATTNDCMRAPCPSLRTGSDIYLLEHQVEFTVASGGTALGASHKWDGNVAKFAGDAT